jgi:hypothetical protein
MGRQAEISRDELKFFRFIERLRKKFADLFAELLKTQLILKGVITKDDWEAIYPNIRFDFRKDSYFTEAKENEMLTTRMTLVAAADPYLGKYFSKNYIQKKILRLSDDEIADINVEIDSEKAEDPNNIVPTQITTQATTQQMTGDIQNQQQLQQQQDQAQLQAQLPQPPQEKQKSAKQKQ